MDFLDSYFFSLHTHLKTFLCATLYSSSCFRNSNAGRYPSQRSLDGFVCSPGRICPAPPCSGTGNTENRAGRKRATAGNPGIAVFHQWFSNQPVRAKRILTFQKIFLNRIFLPSINRLTSRSGDDCNFRCWSFSAVLAPLFAKCSSS